MAVLGTGDHLASVLAPAVFANACSHAGSLTFSVDNNTHLTEEGSCELDRRD